MGKDCPVPSEYPHTRMAVKSAGRQKFGSGEKVYYDCDADFTPSRGSRAVQCVDGVWTKLTLKCESECLTHRLAVQFINKSGKRRSNVVFCFFFPAT